MLTMDSTPTHQKTIDVVAAVIEREGQYLICQRPHHKAHGGLWEFPGGKVEPDETLSSALARELYEELSLTASQIGKRLYTAQEKNSPFAIHFIPATVKGSPQLHEHIEARWLTLSTLTDVELAPNDRAFVDYLHRRSK